jgi:hypothetical protein
MTVHTAVDVPHDAVPGPGVFRDFLYVLMARVAQEGRAALDQLQVTASVRVVTADAVVLRRLVDELIFLQFTLRDDVAGKAKLGVVAHQQVRIVGAVRLVAHRTFANRGRPMEKREPFRDFVTVVAKSGDRFLRKKELVVTAVRIVTLHALACLHGFMNVLLGCLFQMAVFAKIFA